MTEQTYIYTVHVRRNGVWARAHVASTMAEAEEVAKGYTDTKAMACINVYQRVDFHMRFFDMQENNDAEE